MPSRYLIYGLVDPRDRQLRYVGKSCSGLHRPKSHLCPCFLGVEGDTYKCRWLRELVRLGLKYEIVVIQECDSRSHLDQVEPLWIDYLRSQGHPLTNTAPGGRGGSESITLATREKISKALRGMKRSQETRLKVSASRGGRPFLDQYGNRYLSVGQAVEVLRLPQPNIVAVLKGRRKSCGGYRFRYEVL